MSNTKENLEQKALEAAAAKNPSVQAKPPKSKASSSVPVASSAAGATLHSSSTPATGPTPNRKAALATHQGSNKTIPSTKSKSNATGQKVTKKDETDELLVPGRTGGKSALRKQQDMHNVEGGLTLIQLAKKFIKLMKSSKGGIIDLQQAAEKLHVPRRRLYDITNILEGSGLTKKKSKSVICWKDEELKSHEEPKVQEETEQRQTQIGTLVEEEAILDVWISRLTSLREKQIPMLHVSGFDIVNVVHRSSLQCQNDNNETDLVPLQDTFLVHAPLGSFAEVRKINPATTDCRPQEHHHFQHQLFVATNTDLENSKNKRRLAHGTGSPVERKRRAMERRVPGTIELYRLDVQTDPNTHTVVSCGVHKMEDFCHENPDFDALELSEGASDFF